MHVYPCANIKRDFLFWLPSHVQLSGDCCVTIPSELKSAEQVGRERHSYCWVFGGSLNGAIPPMQQSHAKNCSSATLNFCFSCNVTYGSLYSLPVSCLYVDTIKWAEPPNGQKGAGRRRKWHCSQNEATISTLWHCRWAVDTQAAFEHNSRKAPLRLLVNCQ
jgi:hypothetical protein